MKRHGDIFKNIVDLENIRNAYLKAKKGKSKMESVQKFQANEEENLKRVQDLLISKTFTTSKYHERTIYEPKERKIYVLPFFPDRIVQHALMAQLIPIWLPMLIPDTYACISGRGPTSGSRRTMDFARRYNYCLKCDVSKFYPNINHSILKTVVRRKIKCKDTLWLIDNIIDSFPGEKNTPIGNYTSQWFGNLYLDGLDQFVKHDLRFKGYIRYCDDFVLFDDNKKILAEAKQEIKHFLDNERRLTFSKAEVFPVSNGVDFLGYRHFQDYILVRKSTAKRIAKRLSTLVAKFKAGEYSKEHCLSVLASAYGWLRWAKTYNFKLSVHFDSILHEIRNSN